MEKLFLLFVTLVISNVLHAEQYYFEGTATSGCNAYAPNNPTGSAFKQTHGLPTPSPAGQNNSLITLSSNGSDSQGLALPYNFEKGQKYRISVYGMENESNCALNISLANVLLKENETCTKFESLPKPSKEKKLFEAGVATFTRPSEVSSLKWNDGSDNIEITVTDNFSYLWFYLSPYYPGDVKLSFVTIEKVSQSNNTTTNPLNVICNVIQGDEASICGDQTFYNVPGGAKRTIGSIIGSSTYSGIQEGPHVIVNDNGHGRPYDKLIKFHWTVKDGNGNVIYDNDDDNYFYDFKTLTKAYWPLTDVYYVTREVTASYCTDKILFPSVIFNGIILKGATTIYPSEGCKTRRQVLSNTVKVILSSCDDPKKYPRNITTDNALSKCVTGSISFKINGGQPCGDDIKKVAWTLPAGWSWNGDMEVIHSLVG